MDRLFEYDQDHTIAQNFHRWYNMDCDEREDWGECTLDYQEGIKYFSRLYDIAAVEIQDSIEAGDRKWQWNAESQHG